jgi:rRNA maturation protein Nop10
MCVLEKQLDHCGECPEFPCSIRKSLDKRYLSKYRIDLQENIRELSALGPDEWLMEQRTRHSCPSCGECVDPYIRRCNGCGIYVEK